MIRVSVLVSTPTSSSEYMLSGGDYYDCLSNIIDTDLCNTRQVLIRPSSKVAVEFLALCSATVRYLLYTPLPGYRSINTLRLTRVYKD